MTDNWVIIGQFDMITDAEIARGKLASVGIESRLADQHLVQTDWLYAIAVGGIKLHVPEADAPRAEAILAEDWSENLNENTD